VRSAALRIPTCRSMALDVCVALLRSRFLSDNREEPTCFFSFSRNRQGVPSQTSPWQWLRPLLLSFGKLCTKSEGLLTAGHFSVPSTSADDSCGRLDGLS
jgi:hypothetical protein